MQRVVVKIRTHQVDFTPEQLQTFKITKGEDFTELEVESTLSKTGDVESFVGSVYADEMEIQFIEPINENIATYNITCEVYGCFPELQTTPISPTNPPSSTTVGTNPPGTTVQQSTTGKPGKLVYLLNSLNSSVIFSISLVIIT